MLHCNMGLIGLQLKKYATASEVPSLPLRPHVIQILRGRQARALPSLDLHDGRFELHSAAFPSDEYPGTFDLKARSFWSGYFAMWSRWRSSLSSASASYTLIASTSASRCGLLRPQCLQPWCAVRLSKQREGKLAFQRPGSVEE